MLLLHLLPAALLSFSVIVESASLHSTSFADMKTSAPVDEMTGLHSTSFPDMKTSAPVDEMTERMPRSATGEKEDFDDESVDDGSAAEGSGYEKELQENNLKADMENEHRKKGTIIIICSVIGSVVLLVAAILLLKHCKKTDEQGDYSLPSEANVISSGSHSDSTELKGLTKQELGSKETTG